MTVKVGMRHLVMLDLLVKTGSVSETARSLGLTQSAVSHRMREAEKRLNARLFLRIGRKIGFTSAAERLLLVARDVLGELERVQQDLEKLSGGYEDVVRLGGGCYTPYDWLPMVQQAVSNGPGRLALELPSRLPEDPVAEVKTALLDIAILPGRPDDPEVIQHHLASDDLVAVLPPGHALVGKTQLEPADFAGLPYVTHHTRPERGREYEIIFTRHGLLPKLVVGAGMTEAVLQVVRAGLGVTIQPRRTVAPFVEGWGLTLRPLAVAEARVDWVAVTRPRDAVRPGVSAVLEYIRAAFQAG
ncbi:LysR family transcriptional regulator [Govanella unica]|uniref:LysR family transcriptional regulator n=1 Tax=Govanella unica TaxID=2975056 RepID=A0A9X3Z7I6_9PROT|nr:LysR family transcriptional regulator [Govania unica]MDA5194014.1 LysR family transcriptional regulator [Govania unica]